jgi:hypothetical protein
MNAAFAQQLATYFMSTAATATATDYHTLNSIAGYSMINGSAIVSNVCPFQHAKLTDVHMSMLAKINVYNDIHGSGSIHNWKNSIQQLKTQRMHKQQQQQQQQHNVCIRAHGVLLDAAVTSGSSIQSR